MSIPVLPTAMTMTIQQLVQQVFETQVLTLTLKQQIADLIYQCHYTASDLEAVKLLNQALGTDMLILLECGSQPLAI